MHDRGDDGEHAEAGVRQPPRHRHADADAAGDDQHSGGDLGPSRRATKLLPAAHRRAPMRRRGSRPRSPARSAADSIALVRTGCGAGSAANSSSAPVRRGRNVTRLTAMIVSQPNGTRPRAIPADACRQRAHALGGGGEQHQQRRHEHARPRTPDDAAPAAHRCGRAARRRATSCQEPNRPAERRRRRLPARLSPRNTRYTTTATMISSTVQRSPSALAASESMRGRSTDQQEVGILERGLGQGGAGGRVADQAMLTRSRSATTAAPTSPVGRRATRGHGPARPGTPACRHGGFGRGR